MDPKELSNTIMLSEHIRSYMSLDENVPKTPQTMTIPPYLGGIPLGEIQPTDDMQSSLRMFDAVASKAPTMDDSSKLRPLMPKTPCQTAVYYPQKVQPNFETLEYYTRLQPETLFFTFYFMEVILVSIIKVVLLRVRKLNCWLQKHSKSWHGVIIQSI
jgi:CCR4-NOT transcription complex subunit 3